MKNLVRSVLLASALGVAFGGLMALAQTPPGNVIPQIPKAATVQTSDLIQDVIGGVPQVGNVYVTAAQIAGVPGYVNGGAILTGATFTFGNSQTDYFAQPAGTLAAVTLTTAPNPSDGQRECFLSTQTTTALTLTASTGQTVTGGAAIAGTANIPLCWTYQLSSATWFRSP